MSHNDFVRRWKERLMMMLSLPYSNRALKYFPPEFTFRDPVLSLVQRCRNQGQSCALILFCVEGFHHVMSSYPAYVIEKIQSKLQQTMREVLPLYIEEHAIIGVRQTHADDYCVFIKGNANLSYDQLNQLAYTLRKQIEEHFYDSLDMQMDYRLHLSTAAYLLGRESGDTKKAIQTAYHYAQAIATRKLPPHFCRSRNELMDILLRENLIVLAQPILCLKSGEIFGWEMLSRGPKNTPFHQPSELFEFAFQADLLTKLEFVVIKKTLEEISLRQIKEQVFINITAISLCYPLFLDDILEQMGTYDNIRPSQIIFEITERHAIRDYQYVGKVMRSFREHGFRFAIDDAGAGYSSLQSISELIPDMIKIDKSLIQNIDRISVKQSMLKALLFFAEDIQCQVIAEGVEREEEANILIQHAVQMGQGYYFARPEPLVFNDERGRFEEMKKRVRLRIAASSA